MTRTLLQQALDALHPQANRAFVEATKDALRSALAAPAPAVPLTDADLDRIADAVPVDDIGVHITTWHRRFARAVLSAAPAVPDAVLDSLGMHDAAVKLARRMGYTWEGGEWSAAPAVPVSWDRLRILMDGIPTREEFIGGQRQKYVAKEAVMSWLHEGQLRAEREAAQPAAPAVQVVLRQPNLFASAPAVPLTREQQIAIREAHCNTASDEYFGARPQVGDVPRRRIYEAGFKEGWEIAHGIGGGGNG